MTTSPMTTKRRQAIHQYVQVTCPEHGMTITNAVALTLKAQAMKSDDLYARLSRYGYIWRSRGERWVLKK